MSVLVTGASGHVGGAIAVALADAGYEVIALSRRGTAPNHPRIAAFQCDIADETGLAKLPRCEAIVHAAAELDKNPHNPAISRTNAVGTHHLIALAQRWNTAPFVFISGVGIIGTPQQHPITEEHPVTPETAYHASKLYGEHLTRLCGGVILRATSPVGPNTPANRIFSAFANAATRGEPLIVKGTGARRQDYVDVRDIAGSVLLALTKGGGGVFNIASGVATSNLELAQAYVAELNSSSEIKVEGTPAPDDHICWDVSIAHAQEALGYAPRHTLAESVRAFTE